MNYVQTALFILVASNVAFSQTIPFDSDRWEIDAQESRIEKHLGKKSLYIKGGIAWIRDDDFQNGIIEFDVYFSEERGFMGGIWRLQDRHNYEEFYIRPHQSGNPDANQYTPVINGLPGWQLYHGEGYGAPVRYKFNEWTHVKIVVSGSRGEVYISDMEEPALVIHELKRESRPGKTGVSVSNFAPAFFTNFAYQKMDSPQLKGTFKKLEPAPEGTVTRWEVSETFDETSLEDKYRLTDADKQGRSWTGLDTESTGILNLARAHGITQEKNTVFARITVHSEREQVKKIKVGFSDRIKVYFNNQLLYGGNNLYQSRDYRYLGTIGLFDELYLPLTAGKNELWLAVSESFGGWGIQAQFKDLNGIRIE
jgi:hypothetical protein